MAILRFLAQAGYSKKEGEKRRPAPGSQSGFRMALGGATILALSFLLSMHLLPDKVSLQVGDISTVEIRAHRAARYVDSVETERLRNEATARADKAYQVIPRATSDATESVSSIFDILRRARIDKNLPSTAEKIRFVTHNLRFDLNVMKSIHYFWLNDIHYRIC